VAFRDTFWGALVAQELVAFFEKARAGFIVVFLLYRLYQLREFFALGRFRTAFPLPFDIEIHGRPCS